MTPQQKVVIVGGGPVGALTALYVATRGYKVELYDLRDGRSSLNSRSNANEDTSYLIWT